MEAPMTEKEVQMMFVSSPYTTPPEQFRNALQEKVHTVLEALQIPYQRVDTDEAVTLEDCIRINEQLDMKMVKTLFLCNRQQTAFYLLVVPGDKPFSSKAFSSALGISRVSFAPAERMEPMLGTKIGAATVFSALLESAGDVQIVFDQDIVTDEWYGCSDGTTTGYMKLKTEDVLYKVLPYSGHTCRIIRI